MATHLSEIQGVRLELYGPCIFIYNETRNTVTLLHQHQRNGRHSTRREHSVARAINTLDGHDYNANQSAPAYNTHTPPVKAHEQP